MLSPDYQEFANRGPVATRDNTVISRPGTGEVMESTPTLLDCHEKLARKRNFRPAARQSTAFRVRANRAVNVNGAPMIRAIPRGIPGTALPPRWSYRVFADPGSSARLSMTLSTRPNSLASAAVRNFAGSRAFSIALEGRPVCFT